jgi:hypothetical protein
MKRQPLTAKEVAEYAAELRKAGLKVDMDELLLMRCCKCGLPMLRFGYEPKDLDVACWPCQKEKKNG